MASGEYRLCNPCPACEGKGILPGQPEPCGLCKGEGKAPMVDVIAWEFERGRMPVTK